MTFVSMTHRRATEVIVTFMLASADPLLAQRARTIPYDPSISIESRVLPEDLLLHVEDKPLGLITILPEPQDLRVGRLFGRIL